MNVSSKGTLWADDQLGCAVLGTSENQGGAPNELIILVVDIDHSLFTENNFIVVLRYQH